MMISMRLEKIIAIAVVVAVVTAMASGLSVLNTRNSVVSPAWTMISRFIVVLVFGSFGLAVARESQLQGSLLINVEEWSLTVRDIVNYGVLPGLVLGLINYFFFFTYRYRSEEHTSELQSQSNLVCRLLLEKKKKYNFRSLLSQS